MSDPEDDLRELFDRAAEPPSATTLVRLAARAREIPERPRRRRGPGWWAWAAPALVAAVAALLATSIGGDERGESTPTAVAMGGDVPSGTASSTAGSPLPQEPPAAAPAGVAEDDELLAELDEADELGAGWLDEPDPWADGDDDEEDAWLGFEDG